MTSMHPVRTFFKALVIAAICGWLMFFLGVFLALIGMLIASSLSGSKPDLTLSYRVIGATAAITGFVLGFIGSLVYDVRRAARTTS
jgi:hypothetical protein